MENTISITTSDKTIQTWATALKILDAFKKKGFVRRDVFIETIQSLDPSYMEYSKVKTLQNFWQLRVRDEYVNKDLLKVLEQLNAE
jgi:hypothetical protein